jgi:hypothetical protein
VICPSCKREFAKIANQTRCRPCSELVDYWRQWAYRKITKAIKNSRLYPPKMLNCTDCGRPATGYDHRDYERPLAVEPICTQCNLKRGVAKFPLRLPDIKFKVDNHPKKVMAAIRAILASQEPTSPSAVGDSGSPGTSGASSS